MEMVEGKLEFGGEYWLTEEKLRLIRLTSFAARG